MLEPTTPYVHNWHIEAICEHLEAVSRGEIVRLLINVPPGTMKSLLVSVLWPAWEWGPEGRRSLRYIATSFAEGAARRDTRKHRDLVLSDWHRTLWPEVRLVRAGEMSFANTDTGSREGVAFASLTSRRGDRLIIDDPHSTETAESEAQRASTVRAFREGATNRLNDQARSAIVVVMQRLHERDLAGTILAHGMDYEHLMLPMAFERERACRTRIGFSDPRRDEGELLDPRRFPAPVVAALKRDMGRYAWAGQYQQRPAPRDGGLFRRAWFEVVDALPSGPRRSVRAWDLGATRDGGDPTVGVKISRGQDGVFHVEDVVLEHAGPHEVERLIHATAARDGASTVVRLPQDPGAAGKAYAATLVRLLAGYVVRAKPATGDKATRAAPAAAQAEAGNLKLLRAAWNDRLIEEAVGFPTGAHDDQVDALADAVNELALGPAPVRISALKI